MLRVLLASFGLLALVLAACGDDDAADNDGGGGQDTVAEYEDAVRAIGERDREDNEGIFERVDDAFANNAAEATILARLEEALPAAIAASEAALAEFEALTPPEQYAADHERFITVQRELLELQRAELEAVEAGDLLRWNELAGEVPGILRRLVNALSPEFLELVISAEDDQTFVDIASGLNEEELAYLDGLSSGADEFGRRAARFGQAIGRSYPNAEGLLRALRDAGAGEAMQAVYDVISQLEPPPSFAEDHALVVAYYEQAVEIDRGIGEAAESGDAARFLILNVSLGEAASATIFEVSPAVCSILFDPRLCAAAVSVPEGEYEQDLHFTLLEFSAQFGSEGPWGSFDFLPTGSDDSLFEFVAAVGPRVIEQVETTLAAVSALSPPGELADDHRVLVLYFEQLLEAQTEIVRAAELGDGEAMRAAALINTRALCDASRELSPAGRAIVGFHFGREPGEPQGGVVCPAA